MAKIDISVDDDGVIGGCAQLDGKLFAALSEPAVISDQSPYSTKRKQAGVSSLNYPWKTYAINVIASLKTRKPR